MCLTVHWVDDDWILRKKILNFCQISNHKGETIGRLVYKCLQAWGIDKVFTVTVDNASSNDGAIKHLKVMLKGPNAILDCKYLHLRCNAHIINLVVKEGLEEQDKSISKIRNAIRYLRSSPSRYQSFQKSVENERIQCKRKPCLDVETRWNSTFLMLETTLKFVKAFDRLQLVDYKYRSYFHSEAEDDDASTRNAKRKRTDRDLGAPNSKDWENARLFVEHLRIFFDATKKISGSKYVTANLLFGELCKMHTSIAQLTLSPEENKKNMADSMKRKFDKYWDNLGNMNPLLYVALVFDPREKMDYLTFCLELIYGENAKQVDDIKGRVKAMLVELFDSYKKKFDKPIESTYTVSSTSVVNTNGVIDLEEGYKKYLAKKRGPGVKTSEVEVYLNDGCEAKIIGDNSFDVLGWWKINSVRFPVLSQVARHVLAVPISSVASESAFSMGGRVIDKDRSSLTPKVVESLICLQDWFQSTSKDSQDSHLQLEDMIENLEKLEEDFAPEKNASKDSLFEDQDWN